MDLKQICEIAENVTVRMVVSYAGNDRFAVGFGDGITEAIVGNGTPEELEAVMNEQLPGYKAKITKEAGERKAREEEIRRKAAEAAALTELKRKESEKKAAEKKATEANKQNQLEFNLI